MKILIAEDEPRIVAFLAKGLSSHGYTTKATNNGDEVINILMKEKFDLLLLDLGLPMKDGLTVLTDLRGQGISIPIIILTARDDIQDKLAGLEGGADDYITKPFHFRELLARIRLRLQTESRSSGDDNLILQAEDLMINLRTHQVQFKQKNIELSLKEFSLLETLVRQRGKVLTREELLEHVWGYNHHPGSNIVDVYIGYLRKKLDSNLIETVRGRGYRFL